MALEFQSRLILFYVHVASCSPSSQITGLEQHPLFSSSPGNIADSGVAGFFKIGPAHDNFKTKAFSTCSLSVKADPLPSIREHRHVQV
jgi:hypothetical protein